MRLDWLIANPQLEWISTTYVQINSKTNQKGYDNSKTTKGKQRPARAERENLGMMLDVIWLVQATIVIGEPLCDMQTPSWALIHNSSRAFYLLF